MNNVKNEVTHLSLLNKDEICLVLEEIHDFLNILSDFFTNV